MLRQQKGELQEETNLSCNFLEQFGTYSDPDRDPRRWVITNGFMALISSNHEKIKAGDDASAAKWFDVSFKEVDGEWLLRLTHEEDVICARLKETTSQWDIKRSLKQSKVMTLPLIISLLLQMQLCSFVNGLQKHTLHFGFYQKNLR